jgi:Flp pilus assembly protein TadG
MLDDERGQAMFFLASGGMALLLGMGGLSIDVGHAYVVRTQLQGAVNAAALAGVSGLPNGTAPAVALQYEALNNSSSWGTITTPTPTTKCVNMMMPVGQTCTGSNITNAVQVTESVKVPTYFMKMFGVKTLSVGATATASPGEVKPWIVQIVLDTTPSMTASDSNCTGATDAENCALNGIQGLLAKANPCPLGSSTCSAANSNIRVGLMTFPNVQTTDAPDNYNCSGTVAFMPYSTPVIPAPGSTAAYTPITYTNTKVEWQSGSSVSTKTQTLTLTYQPTYSASDMDSNGFYTNYYLASDKSFLNPASTLVKAIGRSADSVNPCLQVPAANGSLGYPVYENYSGASSSNLYGSSVSGENGGGTAFAGAIYAAETALLAEQAAFPKVNGVPTQMALIFLSDGQANALSPMYPSAGSAVTSNGVNNGSGLSVLNDVMLSSGAPATVLGTYPSGFDACQQAVAATKYGANSLGIRMYAVAYGTQNGGCDYYVKGTSGGSGNAPGSGDGTDVAPLLSLGTLAYPYGSITGVVPCTTILNMASNVQYFYSDANQEGASSGINGIDTSCTAPDPNNALLTSLDDIFQGIYGSMSTARLIPNKAT